MNQHKLIINGLVVALLFAFALIGYGIGQNNALKEQNALLLNFACSLESSEFKKQLALIDSTDDFKRSLGSEHEAQWALYKDRLYATCYNKMDRQDPPATN